MPSNIPNTYNSELIGGLLISIISSLLSNLFSPNYTGNRDYLEELLYTGLRIKDSLHTEEAIAALADMKQHLKPNQITNYDDE